MEDCKEDMIDDVPESANWHTLPHTLPIELMPQTAWQMCYHLESARYLAFSKYIETKTEAYDRAMKVIG